MTLSDSGRSVVQEAEMREYLLESLGDDLAAAGIKSNKVEEDLDLLLDGVVDSFRFAELIADVEERFEILVDLTKMNPTEVTRLAALSRYLVSLPPSGLRS
jgi:acyl carrier protein